MKKILFLFLAFYFLSATAQISITFTNVVQPCSGNGAATAVVTGGTAPYTYKWDQHLYYPVQWYTTISTSSSISNVPKGYYFITVTDNNNLTAKDSIYFPGTVHFLNDTFWTSAVPPFDYEIISPANCPSYLANIGVSIHGNNPPYTFSLGSLSTQTNTTTFNFSNVSIGNYSCTVMDNAGCSDTVNFYVYASSGYSVNMSSTPDTCTSNGTATASPFGGLPPYTYLWNTSPIQTTQTATGLTASSNLSAWMTVTVTDANGCIEVGYPYVPDSITAYSIQSTASIQNATCGQSNGSIKITNTGGTPPYSYLWNTGATVDSIINVLPGSYTVTVSDAAGCHEKYVKHIFSISPVGVTYSVTNANCSNTAGSMAAIASGGTPPYTYQWSNGQTTPTISNLSAGFYAVTVVDVNGCAAWTADSVYNPNSCIAKISGTVYNDMNGNCIYDPNESGLPQQAVQLNNGTIYFSDWYGKYYFPPVLNPSGTYTITQTPATSWTQICPVSPTTLNLVGGNNYLANDLYDKPVPLNNDLEVYIFSDSCRPGFSFSQWVVVFNKGTSTMTGTATLQHDPLLNVVNTGNSSFYNSGTQTLTFSFNNLAPYTWYTGFVGLQAPTNAALFTPLKNFAVANPVSGDITPTNNYDTLVYRVTGSYDPNAKSVSPSGVGINGDISTTDSILTYCIHFQNTGPLPTYFVSVTDTLDPNLDPLSLKLVGSFANQSGIMPTVSISNGNVAKFDFQFCHLQPVNWDSANSEGFVAYSIKQKKNLMVGTQIKNRADIFFDYNPPILTNTTLNTITQVGIAPFDRDNVLKIFPNPTNGMVNIEFELPTATRLKVSDVLGNELVNERFSERKLIDMRNYPNGVYFISISTNNKTISKKIIVNR